MRSLISAIVACLLLASAGAQDPQRTFRTSVRTVPIFATVADETGRLVPDLEQEDFEVLDDGKPAQITFFDKQVQPISVVIAIDTSASMTLVLDFVKMAAEAFTRLTHEIEQIAGGATKLTIIHELERAPMLAVIVGGGAESEGAGGGWAWVLSDLKSLLETGSTLAS